MTEFLHMYKWICRSPQENFGVGWLAGVVNGVVINVFNALYGWLAKALNDWENHRTQTEYLHDACGYHRPFSTMYD